MHKDSLILVFAVLSIFVGWRLWSVLGTRTGSERRRDWGFLTAKPVPRPSPAVNKPSEPAAVDVDPAARAGLEAIRKSEPSFQPAAFLQGASIVFERVIAAFAAGDLAVLQQYASPEVFEQFQAELQARRQRGETAEGKVDGFNSCRIVGARMNGNQAVVAVAFDARIINAVFDAEGRLVSGDRSHPDAIVDQWTFSRMVNQSDPNWRIVATQ